MSTSIEIKHNFETAHRLPFLGGKCENLHGHSWMATVRIFNTLYGTGVDENGISVEYGKVKKLIRGWIDDMLDHGTMLGAEDPLVKAGSDLLLGKVFYFGDTKEEEGATCPPSFRYAHKPWPTVEAVAEMLGHHLQAVLDEQFKGLYIDMVHVQETAVNAVIHYPGS